MTIGKKIMLSTGALVAVTLAVAGISLLSMDALREGQDAMATIHAPKLRAAYSLAHESSEMNAALRGVILSTVDKNTQEVEGAKRDFEEAARGAAAEIKELRRLASPGREAEAVEKAGAGIANLLAAFSEINALCARGEPLQAEQARDRHTASLQVVDQLADDLATASTRALEEADSASDALSDRNRWIVISCIALALAIGAAAFVVVRHVNTTLRNLASELEDSSHQVAGAAGHVATASQSLAQGASEQAASLAETSVTAEEINSMATRNSGSSLSATNLVEESERKFAQANLLLDQSVAAMAEISAQSGRISKIIKTIDEIAFQTNILALNAAVEAARAGESGMGFAVVADEVRSLAHRCAQAAKDTASLIDESIAKSGDGKDKVDLVATAIRAASAESARMKVLVDEVHAGSQEQTTAILQIGRAITQMEQVTLQSAASTEEGAAAAEELTTQAAALHHAVVSLTALVGGSQLSPSRLPAAV